MGIVFAILSAVSAAFSYTLLKRSYEDFPPSVAFFFAVFFGLLLWIPLGFFIGINFSALPITFVYALLCAILAEAFYFYVLSKGQLSITGTILGVYPLFVILFSLFINHEHLSLLQSVFIGLTIAGVLIVSFPKKMDKKDLRKRSFILWALAGAIAVGLSDALTKHSIDQSSAGTFLFALAFAQIPVSMVYLSLEKQSLKQFSKIIHRIKVYQFSVYGALLNTLTLVFLFLAFQYTLASIASPIGAAYPGMIIILSVIFLKEKVSKKDLLGLLVTMVGVIGISYFTG